MTEKSDTHKEAGLHPLDIDGIRHNSSLPVYCAMKISSLKSPNQAVKAAPNSGG